jgi:DNA ligase 1
MSVFLVTKPMLAETLEIQDESHLDSVKYPLLATPKLDGIRALKRDTLVSRKFIDIPNQYVQSKTKDLPVGLDGELMMKASFNAVQSAIMSEDGQPNFEYWVFDYVKDSLKKSYKERMKDLEQLDLPDFCVKLIPVVINNKQELIEYEQKCFDLGYEGIMVRTPSSPYKTGRSTLKEGYLLKVKRFADSEAVIIGFEEQMENTNTATKDELGHTKRSSHKSGLVGKGTLGKFLVREVGSVPWLGKQFAIGTGEGLTNELRQQIWNNRDNYLNKYITYKYQVHGVKDLPRLPIWKGFRDERDM